MNAHLQIDILSYWHAGTGGTSGRHVDRVVDKTAAGLPLLNGKHIKGLLRDAVARSYHWGWFTESPLPTHSGDLIQWLFGTRNEANDDDSSRFTTESGKIFIGNALLPEADQNILNNAPLLCSSLYRDLFSTAIDSDSETGVSRGIAKDNSLRGIEVVVPVTLYADVDCDLPKDQAEAIFEMLKQAISLIDHVGGKRNSGLGRAKLSLVCQEETS